VTLRIGDADTDAAPHALALGGVVQVIGDPAGVKVVDAMVHGGPYPASTDFGATGVGTMLIRNFLRPACSQNTFDALLSEDARG
jgi:NADP-dependent aldehyde dehydrogenase